VAAQFAQQPAGIHTNLFREPEMIFPEMFQLFTHRDRGKMLKHRPSGLGTSETLMFGGRGGATAAGKRPKTAKLPAERP
jgi:hypothetical protein